MRNVQWRMHFPDYLLKTELFWNKSFKSLRILQNFAIAITASEDNYLKKKKNSKHWKYTSLLLCEQLVLSEKPCPSLPPAVMF